MWQLIVNGHVMPTLYFSYDDVMKAWDEAKASGVGVICDIKYINN